jgi:hypothetical protein
VKKNQAEIRRLMGSHDVSSKQVADLLKKSQETINQYRCRSGRSISDADLYFLKGLLEIHYPITGS